MVCQGVIYGDHPARIAATIEGDQSMNDYTADQLRDERLRRKWTQRRFADIIGVSTSAVSAWENGEKTPTYNHMRRINEVFDHGADRDRVAELEADVTELRAELARLVSAVTELGRQVQRSLGGHVGSLEADATPAAGAGVRDDQRDTESRP